MIPTRLDERYCGLSRLATPPHKCAAKGIYGVQKMRFELFLKGHVFIGEGESVDRLSEGQFLYLF